MVERLTRRALVAAGLGVPVLGLPGTRLRAQPRFPSRTVRIVVPYAVGVGPDVVTRSVAENLSRHWRQAVIVDNKPGASGIVAFGDLRRAPADGYTLYLADTATMAVNPLIHATLPYDPVRDLVPLTLLFRATFVILVGGRSRFQTLAQMLDSARREPGRVSYASLGNGHASQVAIESMARAAGVQMLHVPFKGGAQAMPAVVAGEVGLSFATIVSSLPLVEAGKLRGLAVTSAKRFPSAKAYPTVAESGLPGYEAVAWYGVFAPAGTPREIVQQLNADIMKIVNSPEVRELFLKQGAESYATTPEEFAKVVQRDVAKWANVVKESGAKAD